MATSVSANPSPLRAFRQFRNLSLEQVASATGTDTGNLSRIERGLQTPSDALAEKLAHYFGPPLTNIHIYFPWRFADTFNVADAPRKK